MAKALLNPDLRIVSGGQTGVDRGALDAALAHGCPCGGWTPAGRLAEDGPIPAAYPLRELPGGGYRARTRRNVRDSDATVVVAFGDPVGGTAATLDDCRRLGRPVLVIDAARSGVDAAVDRLVTFVARHAVRVLNVAGPRASEAPHGRDWTREFVGRFLVRRLAMLVPRDTGGDA